jgi:4-amino-4-deoxy-L-arabinose transferase-like glycosyltransferase
MVKSISLNFLIRIIWYLLIAYVGAFYFKHYVVTHSQFSMSVQTKRAELIQIFCDVGKGFSEASSSSTHTTSAQQNGEPLSLILPGPCKRLRLDLGESGADIKVNTAEIISNGGNKLDILSGILSPASVNDIRVSESKSGHFIAIGNDPYLLLAGDYSIPSATGYSGVALLRMLSILLLVICSLASIIYVYRKYKIKLSIFSVNGRSPLITILIAGALFRIFYWIDSPLPSEPDQLFKMWPDEATYFSIAQYLMTHGLSDYLFSEQSVMAAPGNPIFIALIYTIAKSVNAIRAVNLLLSVLTIVLIYKLGKRTFNKPVGLLAAGICAIHGQLIQYSPTVLTEPLFLCIFILGIYFLVRTLDIQNLPRFRYICYALASAVFMTMAILTRSIAILLPVFLLATIFSLEAYRSWQLGKPSFAFLKGVALPLILPILIFGIVASKNYIFYDRFMIATGGGAALWLGSRADTEGDEPPFRGLTYDNLIVTNGVSHITLEGDKLLLEAAKNNIRENPLGYAWWNVKKIGRLLVGNNFAWFYPKKNILDFYHATGSNIKATTSKILQIILATTIAVYGVIGLFVFRRKLAISLILLPSAFYLIIFSIPFIAIQRLGLPLLMILVIPASSIVCGACYGVGMLRRTALLALLFVLLIVLQILFLG